MSSRSAMLFARARRVIPGGVNSPVRAFRAVGGEPPFIHHVEGPFVHDEDGRRYIDYVGSWGPMLLGHAHPAVISAVQEAVREGLSFGAPSRREVELAERIVELLPSVERVRMVNSGTEATMSAVRLARGFTERDLVVKFEGCYHGHVDSLLVGAGSGPLTLGVPGSPGVPAEVVRHTLPLAFNDLEQAEAAFEARGGEIAAVIVEPIAGNMNLVLPERGFLAGLRDLCDRHGALLIFDEVMTGFRVGAGGAQERYQVRPDLTTLGKVIGGGMPVGAFGGRADVMAHLAPEGPVYQAGTLSGNPVAMAAGLATLEPVSQPGFYEALEQASASLTTGLREAARDAGIALTTNHAGGMFGFFFTDQQPVTRLEQVKACDTDRFARFFHGMLERGVYLAPSAFEAGFVSAAHGDAEIGATIEAAREVFEGLTG